MSRTMRTFNVGFECAGALHHDETQFDISDDTKQHYIYRIRSFCILFRPNFCYLFSDNST